ncbi:MAG TPA: hypothetical protein VMT68_13950 [Caulobacteraceae bacterium]|nr:hypothetical protein [Caulobacteraceae bacterium]
MSPPWIVQTLAIAVTAPRQRRGREQLRLWRHPAYPYYCGANLLLTGAVFLYRRGALPRLALGRLLVLSQALNDRGAGIIRRRKFARMTPRGMGLRP